MDIGSGLLAMAGLLTASAVGYWRYDNDFPVFIPQRPPMPVANGYARAEQAAARLYLVRRPPGGRWLNDSPDQLLVHLYPVRPTLDAVRAAFHLQWQAPPTGPEAGFDRSHVTSYAPFPKCSRYFVAESRLARSQVNLGAAMQRSLDAMELGCRVPKGGMFPDREVGLECHALGLGEAEQVAP